MSRPVINAGAIDPRFLNRTTFENTFRIECRFRLSAADLWTSLSNLIRCEDILELGRSDGSAWYVTVTSTEAAETLRGVGTLMFGTHQAKIVSVSLQEIEIRVHWLPAYIKDDLLFHIFRRFGTVKSVKRESTIINARTTKQNGIRTITMDTDDLLKATIPHLLRFEGGISMLITLRGRPPLCLKCNSVGHMRRDCPGSYRAPSSYADVVTPSGPVTETKEKTVTKEPPKDPETTSTPAQEQPQTPGEETQSQTTSVDPDSPPPTRTDSDDSFFQCGQPEPALVIDEDAMEEEEDILGSPDPDFQTVLRKKAKRM